MPELRVVDDPGFSHGVGYQWRMNGLLLEWRYVGPTVTGQWWPGPDEFVRSAARVAVWRDLFLNPCVTDA